MKAALGDAAWMAGMERNSDIVTLQCYAPLLVNVNGRQWRPNLIGYDALHAYGSPSYYAIRMFSTTIGEEILKATFNPGTVIQGSVTCILKTGTIYVKLINPSPPIRMRRTRSPSQPKSCPSPRRSRTSNSHSLISSLRILSPSSN